MFRIWLLCIAFLASFIATSSKGFVYDTETNEGFKDFRGMGLQQPNNLLDGRSKRADTNLTDIAEIRKVDFSYNDIRTVNDSSFVGWEFVTRLRLDYNNLENITENGFSRLCLSFLSLKGNRLKNVFFKLPCDGIADLTIQLSYNYLQEVRISSSSPILKLDCSGNLFSDTTAVKGLASKNLHLEDNKILHFSLDRPWVWRKKSNLFLDRNSIQRLDGYVSEMNLNTLSISYNLIYYLSGSFFHDAGSLNFVNLSHNRLTNLADSTFAQLVNLKTLDLSENKIAQINPFAFIEMPSLRKFSIGSNPISLIPKDFLRSSTHLQSIEISGAAPIPNYFYSFRKLKRLIWYNADPLSLNHLYSIVAKLQDFQLHNSTFPNSIAILNKYNASKARTILLNQIALEKIPSIMMKTSIRLEELSLTKNLLSRIDLDVIPSSVLKLNLSNNLITHVRKSIEHNLSSLRILDLEHNLLSAVPFFIFQEETQLDFLNLRYNNFVRTLEHSQNMGMKTKYLCYHNECLFLKAKLLNYNRSSGLIVMNLLGCECHDSIKNFEGFSKRSILANSSNVLLNMFKNNVLGCIKHASIFNGGNDLRLLHIFATLASELSSLSLSGWTLSSVGKLHLQCSPQLERLSIIHSGITYINQSAFISFAHLQKLELSHNNMKKFEFDSLQYMPKLMELILSNNLLTSIEIPQNLTTGGIIQLEHLDLSYNALTMVDFGQYMILGKLQKLYLSNNQINFVIVECSHLCANFPIEVISLANNRISKWAPSTNFLLKNVAELDLSSNDLSTYDGIFNDSTCYINLEENNIGTFEQKGCIKGGFILNISYASVIRLSDIKLKYNPSILNASWNFISAINKKDLIEKFTLTALDLSHNNIASMEDGCFGDMTKLKLLHLDYNLLQQFDGINLLRHRSPRYRWNLLEELTIRGNQHLNYISLPVDSSLPAMISISRLCRIVTNNCPEAGPVITEYLQTPETERTYLHRPKMPAVIVFDTVFCSVNKDPRVEVINLTCVTA